MTTLLIVGNSERSRRCDAHCHDAKPWTDCDCCCHGRYHALTSTGARTKLDIDLRKGRFGDRLAELAPLLTDEARQGDLFAAGGA